jgi:glycerophosphoryl diester phosphodiesterase
MADANPLIIAHRGASGYLPEHTLEAKALAFGMGADFLEQDVVATRDDRLVVLHDLHLERVTDVAERYPARHRDDGHWYVRDFDLAELLTLNVHERRGANRRDPVWPGRFPTNAGRFRIATLDAELEMIRGLSASSGRRAGIYPEIKDPAWHREEGVDLAVLLLEKLEQHGYQRREDPVYLQCFDADELRRVRQELGCDLKLVQLLGDTQRGRLPDLRSREGLQELATWADGIGPALDQLYTLADIDGEPVSTGMVRRAREAGLVVHPYTFRADALGKGFGSFEDMVAWFVDTLGIDGMFTDFPDRARAALRTSVPAG